MSKRLQVLEYSRAPVKEGVILGVKIVGTVSTNGRIYPQDVLDRAIPLYENAPVYILHPSAGEKAKGVRRHDDHFGSLQNVHARHDGKIGLGLWGDLHIRQAHPLAQMVMESAGKNFGMSHNAICDMNDEETEVTEIHGVNSVDLVDDPATTQNLFEENEEMTLAEFKEASAELTAKVDALDAKLTTVLEGKKEEPEKKGRLTVLEDRHDEGTEGDEYPEPTGNTHQDFVDRVRGFRATN